MKLLFTFLFILCCSFYSTAQITVDYTNFNNGIVNGWVFSNGSESNQWVAGIHESYYDMSSRSAVYISGNQGSSYGYQNTSTSLVHMYKDFPIASISNDLLLTFKLKCDGEDNRDYLSIFTVSATYNPQAGVEITKGNVGRSEYSGSDIWRGYSVKINRADLTENSFRLVFSWKNDDNGIGENPAAIDDIRLSELNINYNDWTPRLNLPSGRYYSGSIVSGYSAYIAGGDVTGGGVGTTAMLEVDYVGNSQRDLPPLSDALRLNEMVKFDGGLINIGGFYTGSTTPNNKVNKLNLSNFSWETDTDFPQNIFYHRLGVHKWNTLYSVGGSNETNTLLNNVYYRTDESSDWNDATPLPGDGRADGGMEVLNRSNRMIYVGGFTNSFDFPVQVDSVFIGEIDTSNPGNITWSTGSNFPGGPRARLRIFEWGRDKVIVVGGTNGDDFGTATIFDDVWMYDLNEDEWEMLTDIPTGVCAYMGGSARLASGLRAVFISGGIRNGPALSNIQTVMYDSSQSVTSTGESESSLPVTFLLEQNYPNPFNPTTLIRYHLPEGQSVTLKVYDILGKEIRTLVDEFQAAGVYEIEFSGADLSSGVYFYKLHTNEKSMVRKMILMK